MVKLPNLTQKGHRSKPKSIVKKHKDAATEVIGDNGDTMLHLAVREGKNNFVEMLLTFKDDDIEIEKQNSNGQTALHIAAIVGNKYAAELLLKKREKLLYIPDHESHVPLVSAYSNMQFKTFAYLLEAIATADGYLSINKDSFHMLITGLIYRKQYDLAWKLDNMYDNYAIPTFELVVARNCYDITCPNRYTISDISVDSSPHSFGAYFPLLYAVFHYVEEPIKHIEKKRKEYEAAKIL
ncbi:ankyrin repeat-containing protein [Tanacetum coccineum]